MAGDIPHIASSNYVGTSYGLSDFMQSGTSALGALMPGFQSTPDADHLGLRQAMARVRTPQSQSPPPQDKEMANPTTGRRLVKVIVMDPNENVPLDKCILYSGEEKLTDLTDQELFFELDVKALLDKHNAMRVELIDKKVKERVEKLEPVKIRELKMVVVNIAQF